MHFYLKSHPIPVKVNQPRRSCQTRAPTAHYSFKVFFFLSPLLAIPYYITRPGCRDSKHREIAEGTRSPPERDPAEPARPPRSADRRETSAAAAAEPLERCPARRPGLPRARAERDAPLPCPSPPPSPAGTRTPGTPMKPRRPPAEAAGSG